MSKTIDHLLSIIKVKQVTLNQASKTIVHLIDIDVDAIGNEMMDNIKERFKEFVDSLRSNDDTAIQIYRQCLQYLQCGKQYPYSGDATQYFRDGKHFSGANKKMCLPAEKYWQKMETVIIDENSIFHNMYILCIPNYMYNFIEFSIEPNKPIISIV